MTFHYIPFFAARGCAVALQAAEYAADDYLADTRDAVTRVVNFSEAWQSNWESV